MGSCLPGLSTIMADREIVPVARAINNNVPWHDFHACSIKKNDDIRYKWQKLYESNRNGIPYTGAENGAYIPGGERVGTVTHLLQCIQTTSGQSSTCATIMRSLGVHVP